jgi:hypothetical protein
MPFDVVNKAAEEEGISAADQQVYRTAASETVDLLRPLMALGFTYATRPASRSASTTWSSRAKWKIVDESAREVARRSSSSTTTA